MPNHDYSFAREIGETVTVLASGLLGRVTTLNAGGSGALYYVKGVDGNTEERWMRADEVGDVVAPVRRLSRLGFLALFTLEEQLAAYSSDDVRVRLTLGTTQSADFVDLDDPRVLDGLDLFVAVGLLTRERADRILSGEPPE